MLRPASRSAFTKQAVPGAWSRYGSLCSDEQGRRPIRGRSWWDCMAIVLIG